MGSTRTPILELNGKKYDAITGKIIGDSSQHTPTPTAKPSTPAQVHTSKPFAHVPQGPKLVDGVRRVKPHITIAAKAVHQKTEKSKTLMRKGLRKPVAIKTDKIPLHIQATHAVSAENKPKSLGQSKGKVVESINTERVMRAVHTQKSNLVSRFGTKNVAIKTAILPVKPIPMPKTVTAASMHATAPVSAKKKIKDSDIFAAAIAQAMSHKQPAYKQKNKFHKTARSLHVSPNTLAVSIAAMVALVGLGGFAYVNVPTIALKVAASKAGLRANMPAYQPSGFTLAGPITYNPGEVNLQYKSNTDNRDFSVVQQTSSWNSEALLSNVIAPTNKPFQTYQANGRTIYVYDNNKAAWVDGGILYKIEGKAELSSDQLLKIANSL